LLTTLSVYLSYLLLHSMNYITLLTSIYYIIIITYAGLYSSVDNNQITYPLMSSSIIIYSLSYSLITYSTSEYLLSMITFVRSFISLASMLYLIS
jgi:hypothetical protein